MSHNLVRALTFTFTEKHLITKQKTDKQKGIITEIELQCDPASIPRHVPKGLYRFTEILAHSVLRLDMRSLVCLLLL